MDAEQVLDEMINAGEQLSADLEAATDFGDKMEAIETYLNVLVASTAKRVAARHLLRWISDIRSTISNPNVLQVTNHSTDVHRVKVLLDTIAADARLEKMSGGT